MYRFTLYVHLLAGKPLSTEVITGGRPVAPPVPQGGRGGRVRDKERKSRGISMREEYKEPQQRRRQHEDVTLRKLVGIRLGTTSV